MHGTSYRWLSMPFLSFKMSIFTHNYSFILKMIKRFLWGFLSLAILFLAGIYLLIPSTISTTSSVIIKIAENHAADFLTNESGWKSWWPGEKNALNNTYSYKNSLYKLTNLNNSGAKLSTTNNNIISTAEITFIAGDMETTKVTWESNLESSVNPFTRFTQYLNLSGSKKVTDDLLQHLKLFLEDDKNVYHINVKLLKVTDSIILTTNTTLKQAPSMLQVYELIDGLKQLMVKQGAAETNAPMLNIHQSGLNQFAVMVGIPINKKIKTSGAVSIHNMVLGNLLEADVKGGLKTVNISINALETYKKDHNLVAPAMPYQSLITNRMLEKDTGKWITKLYCPIF